MSLTLQPGMQIGPWQSVTLLQKCERLNDSIAEIKYMPKEK